MDSSMKSGKRSSKLNCHSSVRELHSHANNDIQWYIGVSVLVCNLDSYLATMCQIFAKIGPIGLVKLSKIGMRD